MSEEFQNRVQEIKENLKEEGLGYMNAVGSYEDIYREGFEAVKTSGGRNGEHIILPNKRLAVIWRKVFRVMFTDGGWRAIDKDENRLNKTSASNKPQQMTHPFAYANAKITIDESREKAKFKAYSTHEKMTTPREHFEKVPEFYGDMIYIVQLLTGRDDYGKDELMEDLEAFENMEFDVADISKCSKCNPDIY